MKVSGHASQPAIYTVIFTATFLAILAVALRLYTRLRIVRKLDWDDLLSALCLVFTCVFTACVALETHYGLGRHVNSLSKEERTNFLFCLWISVIFYHIGLGLAKLSIVTQCLRVFGSIRKFQIAAWILVVLLIIYTAYTCLSTVFLCQPISYFWHPDEPGKCLPRLALWFLNAALGIISDVAVATLPLPVVKSLRLPRRQKIMLMFVFALGGAVCIISIVRFYCLYAVTTSDDNSWENPQAALYSSIEASASLIFSCVPTYNAFVAKYFPNFYYGYTAPSQSEANPSFNACSEGKRSSSTKEVLPRIFRRETGMTDNTV